MAANFNGKDLFIISSIFEAKANRIEKELEETRFRKPRCDVPTEAMRKFLREQAEDFRSIAEKATLQLNSQLNSTKGGR